MGWHPYSSKESMFSKIKRLISYIVFLIILLIGVSFAALNAEPVSVNYYIGTDHIALSLLLVYVLGVGILLGVLALLFPLLRLKKENHSLKNTLKQHEPAQPAAEEIKTSPL
jgi:putative membrane protein